MKQVLSDQEVKDLVYGLFGDKKLVDAISVAMDSHEKAYVYFQKNPYNFIRLLKSVYSKGFDFKQADQVAFAFGFKPDSFKRIQALVYYDMNTLLSDGSTIVDDYRLIVNMVVGHDPDVLTADRVESVMRRMNGLVFHEDSVQFKQESVYEQVVADNVVSRLLDNEVDLDEGVILDAIRQAEEAFGIQYDDSQKEAILFAVQHRFLILTGGPGTGKTTTIRGIIRVLKILEEASVQLMAPTGRAASRMTEAVGLSAQTIHKALGIPVFATGETVFDYEEEDGESYDVDLTIVDEFSMVDVGLAYHVFKTVPTSKRLICVGDVDQLEPVGHGQVLFDLMQNEAVPVLRLTQIHRQGKGSLISELARLTNSGTFPFQIGTTSETSFQHVSSNWIDEKIEKDYDEAISNGYFEPEDIQILSPVRAGVASVKSLNERIQNYWLEKGELSQRLVYASGYQLHEGDRVMVTVNLENGLTNGEIGYVTEIIHSGLIRIAVPVSSSGAWRDYDIEKIRPRKDTGGRPYFPLELAYAITTHKSQGGEFPLVLYALRSGIDYWAKRSALYTAITRAKKYVVLYGDVRTYVKLSQQSGNRRKTRLQWALAEALEEVLYEDI